MIAVVAFFNSKTCRALVTMAGNARVQWPKVELMDEPYGALDAYTRDKMQQWLLDVWAMHKKTVVFVTHNIEEAIYLADRILVLNNCKFTEEFAVPFARPRREEIKFTPEFSRFRKEIFESMKLLA